MLHRSLAVLLLAMTAPSIALADAAPPIAVDGYPPAIFSAWQSCTGDIEAFCPRIVPGGGRVVRCLIGH